MLVVCRAGIVRLSTSWLVLYIRLVSYDHLPFSSLYPLSFLLAYLIFRSFILLLFSFDLLSFAKFQVLKSFLTFSTFLIFNYLFPLLLTWSSQCTLLLLASFSFLHSCLKPLFFKTEEQLLMPNKRSEVLNLSQTPPSFKDFNTNLQSDHLHIIASSLALK